MAPGDGRDPAAVTSARACPGSWPTTGCSSSSTGSFRGLDLQTSQMPASSGHPALPLCQQFIRRVPVDGAVALSLRCPPSKRPQLGVFFPGALLVLTCCCLEGTGAPPFTCVRWDRHFLCDSAAGPVAPLERCCSPGPPFLPSPPLASLLVPCGFGADSAEVRAT